MHDACGAFCVGVELVNTGLGTRSCRHFRCVYFVFCHAWLIYIYICKRTCAVDHLELTRFLVVCFSGGGSGLMGRYGAYVCLLFALMGSRPPERSFPVTDICLAIAHRILFWHAICLILSRSTLNDNASVSPLTLFC